MRKEKSNSMIIMTIIAVIVVYIGYLAIHDAPLNHEHVETILDNTFLDK